MMVGFSFRKRFLCISALVVMALGAFDARAERTVVSGVAKSYAGKELALKCFSDQIVYTERLLANSVVDESGNFTFVVDVDSPVQAFVPMDVCRGFIYLEPGETYKISLPEYEERTLPQKLDPYFQPKDFLLSIEGLKKGDFNFQMMEFDDAFDYFSMKHLVYGAKKDSVLASIENMQNIFPDLTKPYQREFMDYRFLLLENLSDMSKDSVLLHFNKIGTNVYNSAFWDAFNNILNEFIAQTGGSEEFYIFKKIVEEENAKILFAMLQNRYGVTDVNLMELMAIKIIADLANNPIFNKENVFNLLHNMYGLLSSEENRKLLIAVETLVSSNFIGTYASDFEAFDHEGKARKLSDLKGKYVYLNVCNSKVDKTLKDLNVLMRFHDAYKDNLVIVNLFLYDEVEDLAHYPAHFKAKMKFWQMPNPDAFRKIYGAVNVPSYFLIDPEGKFLMNGAEPNDELRILLQRILLKQ